MTAPRPPFRTDHVGSLPRSPTLKARRRDHEDGRIDAAALAAAEDEAVREAVRLQEAAGLEGITDGEHRRESWHMDFLTHLAGLASEGRALQFDDARSGDFSPLRHAPRHVRVVLGLVSSKVGTLERKDDLERRLDEASRYLPLGQLGVSPQCGLSSTVEGNEVTVEHQKAKLALCAELVREVWGGS